MTLLFDLLEEWTEEEKIQLLEALQKYGTGDIAKLASEIPTKTQLEIVCCLAVYKIRSHERTEANKDGASKTPIDSWLHYLDNEALQNCKQASRDVATALKFIALYEKNTDMDDVVLRDCYLYLSDVVAGKPPKELNDESMHFLMETFAKLTVELEKEDNSNPNEFIENLKSNDTFKKSYASKNASAASDPDLNVLKVPPKLLELNEEN